VRPHSPEDSSVLAFPTLREHPSISLAKLVNSHLTSNRVVIAPLDANESFYLAPHAYSIAGQTLDPYFMMWILGFKICCGINIRARGRRGHHQSFPYTFLCVELVVAFQSGVAAWLTHRHRPRRICAILWLGTSSTLAATGILLVDKAYVPIDVEPGIWRRILKGYRFVRSIATKRFAYSAVRT